MERSCPWTRTIRGFAGRVGRPDSGLWCLGEEEPRRRCVGQRSLHVERLWLQERNPVIIGESRAALAAIVPTALGIVPWKVKNRRVGHPLIGLDH